MNKTNEHVKLFIPTFEIDDCLKEIRECLELGWTGAGFKTEEFESLWNNYSGSRYSLFLNSNTSGLEIAIQSLAILNAWPADGEIITSPLTFVSTNHAILRNNLKPHFVDVDDSFCLDPMQVRAAINGKTVAVLYVGIGGNTGKLVEISQICKEANVPLILDAAHMAGTKYLSEKTFTEIADIAVFSFQAVKNLPTADSGLLSTDEPDIIELAKKLSWLGINSSTFQRSSEKNSYRWMYDVEYVGSKSNGNSIMAAIAKVQLGVLDRDNKYRRELARAYDKGLFMLKRIRFPVTYEEIVSAQHLYQIRVPDGLRDELIQHLNANKIDVGVHYRLNTNYKMYRNSGNSLTQARAIENEVISLPLHLRLEMDDILRVTECIQSWWEASVN